jgi:anaerobic magnesium-protoporphyrin IX monomethyl ester cyclase
MVKILLVRPPELREASFAQFYTLHEALGIGYLAAYLRAHGYPVEILDAQVEGLNVNETIDAIRKSEFNAIGISVISPLSLPPTLEIVHAVRASRESVHITIGGQYPTFLYEPILKKHPAIDTIVRFEGEETFLELVQKMDQPEIWQNIKGIALRKNGQVIATPSRSLIKDLDALPFPARDTLPRLMERGGLPAISSSRGCPCQCSFCSVCAFYGIPEGKIYRSRTPENVVEELKGLKNQYGCDELWFVDDNFFGPGQSGSKRVEHLFSLMEKENLKLSRIDFSSRADSVVQSPSLVQRAVKQGARLVYLGVEAGVQRLLGLYNKGTTVTQNREAVKIVKDSGAEIKMEFIFFNPWITFEEVKETLSFLETVKVYDPYILTSTLTLMKHTPLASDLETGLLQVLPPSPEELTNFDIDSFIPYQIMDERARILFRTVSAALRQFEPALHALYEIYNLLRIKRKLIDDYVLSEYREVINDYQRLINETSLDIFKEAITTIEKMTALEDMEDVLTFHKNLSQKTLRFAAFLSSVLNTQEQALLLELHESEKQP